MNPEEPEKEIITVALAEDEAYNYLLLKEILGKVNIHLIWFKDGKEICDYFESVSFPTVRLVLMDLKMPRMDGAEAAGRIHARFPDLPIVAQTAHALEQDYEFLRQQGFTEILTKPINRQRLLDLVNKILKGE
jgi:two-component system, cell cycle response regulator DivK